MDFYPILYWGGGACATYFSTSYSVKTEDDFCPPAGDGAPARENAEGPAEDEGPVTPLLLPEDPVRTGGPC